MAESPLEVSDETGDVGLDHVRLSGNPLRLTQTNCPLSIQAALG